MILTSALKQFIENYRQTLPTEEHEKLKWDIEAAIDLYSKDLERFPDRIKRGQRVHFLLEEEIKKSSHIPVSCYRGCAACCHFEVEITKDEAEILKLQVQNGTWIDRDRLRDLSLRDRQGEEWKKGMVQSNRCLFLGQDNACRIYDSRPASCRKLAVTSSPSDCETVGGNPTTRLIPMAEILINAALSCKENEYGSMAKLLSKSLETLSDARIESNVF